MNYKYNLANIIRNDWKGFVPGALATGAGIGLAGATYLMTGDGNSQAALVQALNYGVAALYMLGGTAKNVHLANNIIKSRRQVPKHAYSLPLSQLEKLLG